MFGLKHFRRKIRIKKGVINENISFLKIEKLKLKTQCFEFFWRWIANFIKFGVRIIIKLSKIIVIIIITHIKKIGLIIENIK